MLRAFYVCFVCVVLLFLFNVLGLFMFCCVCVVLCACVLLLLSFDCVASLVFCFCVVFLCAVLNDVFFVFVCWVLFVRLSSFRRCVLWAFAVVDWLRLCF